MTNVEASEVTKFEHILSVGRRSPMMNLFFWCVVVLCGVSIQRYPGLTRRVIDNYRGGSAIKWRRVQSMRPPFSVQKYFNWKVRWFMLDNRYDRRHLWTFDDFHWTCHKLTTFQVWDMQHWIKEARLKPETKYVRRPFGFFREIPIYRFRW